jgi:hypothetical protein
MSREKQVSLKYDTRITATLREDLRRFTINIPLIFLGKRNVSDRSCTKNQNTFYFDIQRTVHRDIFL